MDNGQNNNNKPPPNTVALYIVDDTTAAPPRTSEELTVAVGAEVDQQQQMEQSTATPTANVEGQNENAAAVPSTDPQALSNVDQRNPDETGQPVSVDAPSQQLSIPPPAAPLQKVASASEYAADLNEFEAFSTDNEQQQNSDAESAGNFDGLQMMEPNIVAEGINDDPNLDPALEVSFSRPNFVLAVESRLMSGDDENGPTAAKEQQPTDGQSASPPPNVPTSLSVKRKSAANSDQQRDFAKDAVIAAPANPQWHEGQRPKTSRGARNSVPAGQSTTPQQQQAASVTNEIVEDIDQVRAFSAREDQQPTPAAKPQKSPTGTKSAGKSKKVDPTKPAGNLNANKTVVNLNSGGKAGLAAEKQRRPKKESAPASQAKQKTAASPKPAANLKPVAVSKQPSKRPAVAGSQKPVKTTTIQKSTVSPPPHPAAVKPKPKKPAQKTPIKPNSTTPNPEPTTQTTKLPPNPTATTRTPQQQNGLQQSQKRTQSSSKTRSESKNSINTEAASPQPAKKAATYSTNNTARPTSAKPASANKTLEIQPEKKPIVLSPTAAKLKSLKEPKRVDIVSDTESEKSSRADRGNIPIEIVKPSPRRKKSLHVVVNKQTAGRPKTRGKSVSRQRSEKAPDSSAAEDDSEKRPRTPPKKIVFNPAPTNEDVRRDKNRKACKKALHMLKRDKYLCKVVQNKTRRSAEAYNEQARKRLGLSDEDDGGNPNRPFACIPLTATVSESAGTRSPLLMRYPSFSARKANVGVIETFGAPEPRIRTPLTEALVADDRHWTAVEKLDEETNGANVHKRPRRIEDLYSMRVKKFWVREQLLNTPFLQHLRRDQRYNDMQHHERNRTEAVHAANEHIIQHLYHMRTHPTRTLDNWNPKGFGWQVNMMWRCRQRAWRQLLEVNYRLFAHLLNVRPYYPSYDAYCRRSIDNLTYQMFITQQKRTKRLLMRRLKYEMKSLSNPEYEQGGPAWWRPLKVHEQRAFEQIQAAYAQYCDSEPEEDENSGKKRGSDSQQQAIDDFVLAMRTLCPPFVEFHLREAIEALQTQKFEADKAVRKKNSSKSQDQNQNNLPMPLLPDLLYELRKAKPIKQAPYNMRSFLFVCVVRLTPPEQIREIRIALKNFFTFRPPHNDYNPDRRVGRVSASESKRKQLDARSAQSKHVVCELRPLEVFTRTRDIRDALRPYHTPYGHIAIDWMVRLSSERRRRLLDEGPYQIDLRLREHRAWCRASMYTILKLPDYALLPPFKRLYKEPIDNYRPKEKTFLIKVYPRVE